MTRSGGIAPPNKRINLSRPTVSVVTLNRSLRVQLRDGVAVRWGVTSDPFTVVG